MKVNEIFYSLQGEGRNAGRAAVFIRLSGCNLKCPFCDTQHQKGENIVTREIVTRVLNAIGEAATRFVVITGGEPTIQDCTELLRLLHEQGFEVALETNGTFKPAWLKMVDFVTLSPKGEFVKGNSVEITECDELKVVYNGKNDLSRYNGIKATYYYLQPCDTGDKVESNDIIRQTIAECKRNPKWRLSLQTQKIVGIQ